MGSSPICAICQEEFSVTGLPRKNDLLLVRSLRAVHRPGSEGAPVFPSQNVGLTVSVEMAILLNLSPHLSPSTGVSLYSKICTILCETNVLI